MSEITFQCNHSTFNILNPFNNFTEEQHTVEVRRDPLLGDTSIYNPYLKDKARAFFGDNDQEILKRLETEGAAACIFCGEAVRTKTAMYVPGFLPEGRIIEGEAVLFANVFSVGAYHPVVSLSSAHFLRPSEFSPELITNGLRACQRFLRLVYSADETARYVTVNSNYLFPAGASLVHPHIQMLITPLPYSYHNRLLNACEVYSRNKSASYYSSLVQTEKSLAQRYIACLGSWDWLTAFAPMGSNEVVAIHRSEHDFGLLPDGDLDDLAKGISKVLAFYEGLGHLSFNYSLYAVRDKVRDTGFRCLLRLITRQNISPNYRNDDYFLQKLLQAELIINLPEDLAKGLREVF